MSKFAKIKYYNERQYLFTVEPEADKTTAICAKLTPEGNHVEIRLTTNESQENPFDLLTDDQCDYLRKELDTQAKNILGES